MLIVSHALSRNYTWNLTTKFPPPDKAIKSHQLHGCYPLEKKPLTHEIIIIRLEYSPTNPSSSKFGPRVQRSFGEDLRIAIEFPVTGKSFFILSYNDT